MITAEQARNEYGFRDCSGYEDSLALGLYSVAQGLFPNKVARAADMVAPMIINFMAFSCVLGMIILGPRPMLLLMLVALVAAYMPQRLKILRVRSDCSGMRHIENEQGKHFIIGYGFCEEKKKVPRSIFLSLHVTDYKMRVRVGKGVYIDDVIVMKSLFDEIKQGNRICMMMADSPNAKQIIGAPVSFAETALDKKKTVLQQFEIANPATVRVLTEGEREMYATQFRDRIRKWEDHYQKLYIGSIIGFAIGGALLLVAGLKGYMGTGGTLLMWLISVYAAMALFMQKKEFRRYLDHIENADSLSAVDVKARREETYKEFLGTQKRASSSVYFKDRFGVTIKTLHDAESLKTFLQDEEAVLILCGKETIPLHSDVYEYTIHEDTDGKKRKTA